MKHTHIISTVIIAFLLVQLIAPVSALTASLGNSRAVVHATTGDLIERYVLVRNVNDEAIAINVSAGEGLAASAKITEPQFTLEPGAEKKVYFTLMADDAGTTETKINVGFAPIAGADGGSGVGLAASVIVIAVDENGNTGPDNTNPRDTPSTLPDDSDDTPIYPNATDDGNYTGGVSVHGNGPGPIPGYVSPSTTGKISFTPLTILFITTGILMCALVVLIIVMFKKKKVAASSNSKPAKKKVGRPNA